MGNKYMRGMRCSFCGVLRYFHDSEMARMNSSVGNRVQCQSCGHTHWDECPKSKRVKELKAVDRIRDIEGDDVLKGPLLSGKRRKGRTL